MSVTGVMDVIMASSTQSRTLKSISGSEFQAAVHCMEAVAITTTNRRDYIVTNTQHANYRVGQKNCAKFFLQ